MTFDWYAIYQLRGALLQGWLTTMELVFLAALLGATAGSLICFGRLVGRGPLYFLSTVYVNAFRGIPETVLIFWIYFCGPIFFTFSMNAMQSGLLAMSLVSSAFFAEVARAGIESVPKGQWDAARALGLSRRWIWAGIVLPQAGKAMLPAGTLLITQLVKISGLVAAIGVPELVYTAEVSGAVSFKFFEFFSAIAVIYFAIIFPLSMLAKLLEKRLREDR